MVRVYKYSYGSPSTSAKAIGDRQVALTTNYGRLVGRYNKCLANERLKTLNIPAVDRVRELTRKNAFEIFDPVITDGLRFTNSSTNEESIVKRLSLRCHHHYHFAFYRYYDNYPILNCLYRETMEVTAPNVAEVRIDYN